STNTVINGSNVTIGGALTREGAGSRNVTFEVPGVIDLQGPTSLLQNMSVYGGGFLDVGADMMIAGVLNISNTTLRLTGADAMRTLGAVQGIQMGDVIGNGKSLLLNSGMPVSLLGDMTGVHDF